MFEIYDRARTPGGPGFAFLVQLLGVPMFTFVVGIVFPLGGGYGPWELMYCLTGVMSAVLVDTYAPGFSATGKWIWTIPTIVWFVPRSYEVFIGFTRICCEPVGIFFDLLGLSCIVYSLSLCCLALLRRKSGKNGRNGDR